MAPEVSRLRILILFSCWTFSRDRGALLRWLHTSPFACHGSSLSGKVKSKDDKEELVMLAASMAMSLGIVKILGSSNPPLVEEVATQILKVVDGQRPLCLSRLSPTSSLVDVLEETMSVFLAMVDTEGSSEPMPDLGTAFGETGVRVQRHLLSTAAVLAFERGSLSSLIRVADILQRCALGSGTTGNVAVWRCDDEGSVSFTQVRSSEGATVAGSKGSRTCPCRTVAHLSHTMRLWA